MDEGRERMDEVREGGMHGWMSKAGWTCWLIAPDVVTLDIFSESIRHYSLFLKDLPTLYLSCNYKTLRRAIGAQRANSYVEAAFRLGEPGSGASTWKGSANEC